MAQWVDQAVMALLDKLLKSRGCHHSQAVSTEIMGCLVVCLQGQELAFNRPWRKDNKVDNKDNKVVKATCIHYQILD